MPTPPPPPSPPLEKGALTLTGALELTCCCCCGGGGAADTPVAAERERGVVENTEEEEEEEEEVGSWASSTPGCADVGRPFVEGPWGGVGSEARPLCPETLALLLPWPPCLAPAAEREVGA